MLGPGAVGAGLDFDAEEAGVRAAVAQDVGDAAAAVGMGAPFAGVGVVLAAVGLGPGGEAVGVEVAQDGAGDFFSSEGTKVERGLGSSYGHGTSMNEPMLTKRATYSAVVG